MEKSEITAKQGTEWQPSALDTRPRAMGSDAVGKIVRRPFVPFCELKGRTGSYPDDNGLEPPAAPIAHVNHPWS
jgi:hypothetical protein